MATNDATGGPPTIQPSTLDTLGVPVAARNRPSLLGLPVECRSQIYTELLLVDTGPERLPNRVIHQNFNVPILGVNCQIREEAMRVLLKENTWIYVCLKSVDDNSGQLRLLRKILHCPQASMFHLTQKDLQQFTSEATLGIHIGKGLGAQGEKTDPDLLFLFAYNQQAYVHLCLDLFRTVDEWENMSLVIGRIKPMCIEDLARKLLFPLGMICGIQRFTCQTERGPFSRQKILRQRTLGVPTWLELENVVRAWQYAGDRAFAAGNYIQAIHHYDCGCSSILVLHHLGEKHSMLPEGVAANEYSSLQLDVVLSLSHGINKLVESRRRPSDGQIACITLEVLTKAIDSTTFVLQWGGLVDDQRHRAHMVRCVAYRNLGDWTTAYGDGSFVALASYDEAGKDLFFAEQLLPDHQRNQHLQLQADIHHHLYRSDTTLEHAPMTAVTMQDHAKTVLHFDARIPATWTETIFAVLHLVRKRLPKERNRLTAVATTT